MTNNLLLKKSALGKASSTAKLLTHQSSSNRTLTKEQEKGLKLFFNSFTNPDDCFDFIDSARQGYVLGADWAIAV